MVPWSWPVALAIASCRLLEVALQIALLLLRLVAVLRLQVRHLHLLDRMSGVMPCSWIERPDGV